MTPTVTGGPMLMAAREAELRERVRHAPARYEARLQRDARRARRAPWWKRWWS
ncbi:MAG TPA: hypothetical protein VF024_12200 [Solirubrobacteraceae bacterium]